MSSNFFKEQDFFMNSVANTKSCSGPSAQRLCVCILLKTPPPLTKTQVALKIILNPDRLQKNLKSLGQMLLQAKSALFMDID